MFIKQFGTNLCHLLANMAQSVEHHLGKVEVTGSIPVISSTSSIIQKNTIYLYN